MHIIEWIFRKCRNAIVIYCLVRSGYNNLKKIPLCKYTIEMNSINWFRKSSIISRRNRSYTMNHDIHIFDIKIVKQNWTIEMKARVTLSSFPKSKLNELYFLKKAYKTDSFCQNESKYRAVRKELLAALYSDSFWQKTLSFVSFFRK